MCASGAAEAQSFKPSAKDQVTLGQRAANELRQKERVLPSHDERVQKVRAVGNKLLAQMNYGDKPWEFTFDVIQNKQVNAFALPGGPIFIYTGLLDRLQTEDQLAGIMAHEIIHVTDEHWAEQYADSQKRALGINLLLILTRANRTAAGIAGITNQVVFELPFSRKAETEADVDGFDVMVKAGYNPQGMADVFAMFQKMSKGGNSPEFLSDHPNDNRRIESIQNRIRQANRSFPSQRPLRFEDYTSSESNTRTRYRLTRGEKRSGGGG